VALVTGAQATMRGATRASEYARRHSLSDRASGEFRAHDAQKLTSLGVEYELEASSLLALQHAVEAYRKLRPEADWNALSPRG
jgi:hypothetical protein